MDKILVLDFGGQYNQLIARRVREQHVYAEIRSCKRITIEEIKNIGYKGIIFTGGPNSVYDPASPTFDKKVLELGIPVLGICYGAQLIAHLSGGKVESAKNSSEYGKTELHVENDLLYEGVSESSICWMSHTVQCPAEKIIRALHHQRMLEVRDYGSRAYAVSRLVRHEQSHPVLEPYHLSQDGLQRGIRRLNGAYVRKPCIGSLGLYGKPHHIDHLAQLLEVGACLQALIFRKIKCKIHLSPHLYVQKQVKNFC